MRLHGGSCYVEFVAVARAETSFEGGVEVQLKPSRWVGDQGWL
jgi:hypothetical protein